MKQTEKQKEQLRKYLNKKDRINGIFPKGTNERIRKLGYSSLNHFVVSAVMEKLEREENYKN